jgi:tRNA(fMet)-specific endonuclease VapC
LISHLVDSDWTMDYLKGRERATELLPPFIQQGILGISIIVMAEVLDGVLGATNPATRRDDFDRFLQGVTLVGIDVGTVEIFARIRRQLRPRGEPIGDHDLWIASIALQYDMTLIARDHHFDRIPELKRG